MAFALNHMKHFYKPVAKHWPTHGVWGGNCESYFTSAHAW